MTRRVGIVMSAAALAVMVSSVAFGQPPAGAPPAGGRGGRGGGRGGPAYVSPEVSADGNITVRLFAPNAQQVTASGELDGKPHPMTKGEDGIWSVTVGPLPPDIYTYSFNVDGLTVLDPRNTNTKMGSAGQNMDQTYASFLKDPAVPNKQFKMFWMAVGKDDTLVGAGDKAFDELLTAKGVKHSFKLTEGRHEWTVWRQYLNEVAPLLFR